MSEQQAGMSFDAATEALLSPGGIFEMQTEDVLGEQLPVFVNRSPSLRALLEMSAGHGDKEYYVFDTGERCTYAQNIERVATVAAALSERGIGKGDRVAILSANNPGWITAYWAVVSLGGIAVAMNGWWAADEIRYGLEQSEPKLLLADRRRLDRLEGADPGVPTIVFGEDFDELLANPTTELPTVEIDEDDPAVLLFTSGTTGRPKGALLSHRNILGFVMTAFVLGARVRMVDPTPRGMEGGSTLVVFPLFHVSGMFSAATTQLAAGGKTVWTTGRFDPANVIALSKAEGISNWSGSATHIFRLLDHPDLEDFNIAQIGAMSIGGSATTPELIRATEERFPHLAGTFGSGYGSTETGSLVSHAMNSMLRDDPTSVGPPLPGIDVKILDDDGNEVPDGVDGNIVVRSALVMLGYWNNDEANDDTFLPGRWVKTGDYGQMRDGELRMASRKRDLIIRGGENVYPAEIENRLEEHPEVAEVAVFGVDHRELGQEVKAVVVLDEGATVEPEALKAFVAEKLAYFKVPAFVEIRTEPMPRNATGKVMKHVLSGDAENTFVEE